MTEIYKPSKTIIDNAHVNKQQYDALYQESIIDPDSFWLKMANKLEWFTKPTLAKNTSYTGNVEIKWYEDGFLNASYNCIDRHLPTKKDDIAIIYEGDEPGTGYNITFQQLHDDVCRLANALKARNVKKGDRVTIYMPMIPEAGIAMLACARIGAVHSVVFGGFSPDALKDRILGCKSDIIITANEGLRAGKTVPLKSNVDDALKSCPDVHTALVYQRTKNDTEMAEGRDIWWHDIVPAQEATCEPERMNAEDPLFILYTSGSTGKPKGVLHTTGGYMVYAHLTFETTFDFKPGEVFWCTADFGWVTGHSYIIYGPLSAGATTVVFESVPNYPDPSRFWQMVETHKINLFYTAPTAIRALIKAGDEFVTRCDRSSLRILGSVGEPINHEAWLWYYNVVGEQKCPIVDTWWQTETGGHLLTPLPGATDMKPGSACQPFFGIKPAIVDNNGNILEGEAEGNFVITDSWPGQMRSLYGDHDRFIETYFTTFPGMYFTGDGARRDKDGYYWITGRVDDVINVSGHRLGTAEIESAINEHESVAESAVTGYPHDIKGTGIYAYVTLKEGIEEHDELMAEIKQTVRTIISPIATPDVIQWAPGLPKTRSGKIMRRILRKIAANEADQLGDTSTLGDPSVVDDLIEGFKRKHK